MTTERRHRIIKRVLRIKKFSKNFYSKNADVQISFVDCAVSLDLQTTPFFENFTLIFKTYSFSFKHCSVAAKITS